MTACLASAAAIYAAIGVRQEPYQWRIQSSRADNPIGEDSGMQTYQTILVALDLSLASGALIEQGTRGAFWHSGAVAVRD